MQVNKFKVIKMKNTHMLILAGALGLAVVGGGIMTGAAFANYGNSQQFRSDYSAERHEAMINAFENRDYNSWQKLQEGRGRAGEVVNKDNFGKFSEMRNLMLEGKIEEANRLRQELGLGQRNGSGPREITRGQNRGGNFIDRNGDGRCDRF